MSTSTKTKSKKEEESLAPWFAAGGALGLLFYSVRRGSSGVSGPLTPPVPQFPQEATKDANAILDVPPPQPPTLQEESEQGRAALDATPPKKSKPQENQEKKKNEATKQLIEDRRVLEYLRSELVSIEEQLLPIRRVRLTDDDVLRLQESRKNIERLLAQQELRVKASEEKLQSLL